MKNKPISIPKFKNEKEEAEFWDKNSPLDHEDFKPVNISFPSLRPSTQSVTFRAPKALINDIKMIANERDIPYQSLMKQWLNEKVKEEFKN